MRTVELINNGIEYMTDRDVKHARGMITSVEVYMKGGKYAGIVKFVNGGGHYDHETIRFTREQLATVISGVGLQISETFDIDWNVKD